MSAPSLSPDQRALIARIVPALAAVPGVAAVVLGGSHARGRARADSDIDIGLYYRAAAPIDVAAIRALASQLNDTPGPVVSGLGEWGEWVDGGGWLTVEGQRVDLLYRSTDKVEAVLADAQAGRWTLDWAQQPPYGFFGPTLLGEAAIAVALHDPSGMVTDLKARVSPMPDALRRALIQDNLWQVDFGLRAFAPKFAAAGDAYGVAGCLTRFASQLVLALFALNGRWLLNEKTALAEIAEFAQAPDAFGARISTLLGKVGTNAQELGESLSTMQSLFREQVALAPELYRPAWDFEGTAS